MRRERKARIIDIAHEANVSTATVDRVLNNREGVGWATTERVKRAINNLAARGPSHSRAAQQGRRYAFDVILPAEAGPSTEALSTSFRDAGLESQVEVICSFVEKMNPIALAAKLMECAERGSSGLAFQALDHPEVRNTVTWLATQGMPTLALMSNLHGSEIIDYVGMDNRAAGRTAGQLMGRFLRSPGKVAVLWGGQLYCSHEEREMGFRSVLRSEYPQYEVLDLVSGRDDSENNYAQINAVLEERKDLVGIYNVGGGTRGIVQALTEHKRDREIIFVGHNLTERTQRYLLDGSMDVVIHQDMRTAANKAVTALIDFCERRTVSVERLPVQVVIKENLQDWTPSSEE
ncbi:MAG: LacI family DNA-binding transcriptional regulator [Rhodospirillales bacterium]|jgi:LacI family transcriptional regulator|nr:LacI family DNA-binding transcriptional regulator [Rhodospirillales bacterium]